MSLTSLAETRGVAPDVVMLNSLLDALVECRAWNNLEIVWRNVSGARNGSIYWKRVTPNARSYNIILKGLAVRGDIKGAVTLTERMDELNLWDDVTTNTLVRAALAAGEYDMAESVLGERTSYAIERKQHPNVGGYTDLVDAYARGDDLEKALETLRVMTRRGVRPNDVTFTCVIAALARRGRVDEAERMLRYMKSAGVMPSRVTYNAFLNGLLLLGEYSTEDGGVDQNGGEEYFKDYDFRVDRALSILSDMISHNVYPDATTVTTLIEGLTRAEPTRTNDIPLILETVTKNAETANYVSPLSPVHSQKIATALIRAYASVDDFENVQLTFRNLENKDVIAFNAYLDACVKMGRIADALDTFGNHVGGVVVAKKKDSTTRKTIGRRLRPDVISYTVMMRAMVRGNKGSAARRMRLLYQEMREVWGIMPDITLVDTILSGMIQSSTFGLSDTDTKFTARVLRDAASLPYADGEYNKRKRILYSVLVGRNSEVWKNYGDGNDDDNEVDVLFQRKAWNKVDSRFRVLGQGVQRGDSAKKNKVDKFLKSKGW
eukprot:CAMPEP_0172523716 /NCGR_PEP_ID=MMETSP1066-20121228/293804_1 /TAXON_ID=671091 /ORGANISM="Coscinodiscus wailesii, Strain CCMP2513" /LENGTH=547 /DNA_ID=CAMNT_0013306803 /DNA_START=1242 /DNA_END=2882 /DNA_ORIENTATION=-